MKDMRGQNALLMFSEVCLNWVNSLFRYTLPSLRTLHSRARDDAYTLLPLAWAALPCPAAYR